MQNKLISRNLNKEVTKAIRYDTRNHLNNTIQKCGFWNGVSQVVPTKSTSKVLAPVFNIDQLNKINAFYATIGAPPVNGNMVKLNDPPSFPPVYEFKVSKTSPKSLLET